VRCADIRSQLPLIHMQLAALCAFTTTATGRCYCHLPTSLEPGQSSYYIGNEQKGTAISTYCQHPKEIGAFSAKKKDLSYRGNCTLELFTRPVETASRAVYKL
jgi:hypothetical protein